MRLVTWHLGHRLDGGHVPENVITALASLAPDIVILTERLPGPARRLFLASLAGIGLTHSLAPTPGRPGSHALIASRLKLLPGSLTTGASRDPPPPRVLHAHATTGMLDVLGLGSPVSARRPAARRACWEWLVRAAATLKQRRAILIGDFEVDDTSRRPADVDHLRHLTDAGWQRAVPANDVGNRPATGDAGALDYALLSPSMQRIDARYALAAAGLRLSGTQDSLSDHPVLVVDVQ